MISNNVLGRKVYYHLSANAEISTNSAESMHEAITVIEIVWGSQWCTWIHVWRSSNTHWTYSMNTVHFLTWQVVTADIWIATLSHTKISDFQEACWLAFFETEHLKDTETGNTLKPYQWPQTQIHSQCDLIPWIFRILVSMNIWAFI
jgi:hypothetical protein